MSGCGIRLVSTVKGPERRPAVCCLLPRGAAAWRGSAGHVGAHSLIIGTNLFTAAAGRGGGKGRNT